MSPPNKRPANLKPKSKRGIVPRINKKRRRGGIAGIIFIGSFAGLLVLVLGALVFNELRTGLTQARADTLRAQGSTIASVLAEAAVIGDPEPMLDDVSARLVLKRLFREPGARLRLYSKDRHLIADSSVLYDEISVRELPPLGLQVPDIKKATEQVVENARILVQGALNDPKKALAEEVGSALEGNIVARERFDENGNRVVSVSIPIQRVRAVVGSLTLESSDVSQIVSRERRSLIPFVIAAVLANLLMAALLAWLIARPLQKLADAADRVSQGHSNRLGADELINRPDEIGELAQSLNVMIASLHERIDANESFAADVAHEIKNPLAAIKNAAELLQTDLKPEQRVKLESIMFGDLKRVDKLVTDISNASRLDAELARRAREPVSIKKMLDDICGIFDNLANKYKVEISLNLKDDKDELFILAREEAINRVFINLIENAISFTPEGKKVEIKASRKNKKIIVQIEDEGGGIPDEALERIFERFYTHRPKGQAIFGAHSGLGLAIARQIIESHDGRLWAQNLYNENEKIGARFIVEMPA